MLLDALIGQGRLEREALDALVSEQQARFEQARERLAGTAFLMHPVSGTLYIQDFLSGDTLNSIQLASAAGMFTSEESPELDISDWEPWGMALCSVNAQNGSVEGFLKLDQEYLYGLVVTPSTSFIHVAEPMTTPMLGQSTQCLFHRVHRPGPGHTAFDLFLSEDRAHLCVTDRQAGSLTVINTASYEVLGTVQIRKPGSNKALNVAFDYYEPKLFVSDNLSSKIQSLSLEDMQLERVYSGEPEQVFGNLVRAPDIRFIYALQLKPTLALVSINIENNEIEETLPLKGSSFSTQHIDATDIMALSPDQNHLMLVTSHPEPQPFTPAVVVIDPHSLHQVRLQSIPDALRDQIKPAGIVFPLPNPVVRFRKTPTELALAKGLITQSDLDEQSASLLKKREGFVMPEFVDLDGEDAPSEGQGRVPTLIPVAGEPIVLDPAVAIPAIMLALSQKLAQQTGLELQAHEDVIKRFETLAEDYRVSLESYDSVEVLVEDILTEIDPVPRLETFLTRQDILSLMASEQLSGQLAGQKVIRPPASCPVCSRKLKGSWDCWYCFFELESPNRREKKLRTSLDSLGALPRFQLLLADPKRRRLLILDDTKTIDWQLQGYDMACPHPWGGLWLPNQNLLVVDREGSRVFECSPTGQLQWTLDQTLSPDHVLNGPVKATYFSEEYDELFLIVDQGHHRVLVIDRKQKILWQYGWRGVAGNGPGQLSSPTDLQLTADGTYLIADTGNHRVIEVNQQEIIREWGPVQGLQSPVYAQRLWDGDTLVVDAGNYRLLELDPDGEIVTECFYFTEEMGDELRIDLPTHVIRREKKSVVLMDEDKIIEILIPKRRLVWSSLLKHLARRVEIGRDAFDKSDSYVQSFYQYRIPTLQELLSRLREENRLESSSGIAARIYENLNALVEQRRERDRERAARPQVKRLDDARLSEVPLVIIDRTNQQVVRVDRDGEPIWYFGTDPEYKLLRPTHVCLGEESVLIADTNHDRVLEISLTDGEILQIIGGKDDPTLSRPRSAWRTVNGNTLIADQGHKRLAEFDGGGTQVWEFSKNREISYPFYARELGKGTILFVDWALHVVKEINRAGELIWQYGTSSRMGHEDNQLASPEYAMALPSGAMLIADTGNHRIIEVSPKRRLLWEFSANKKYNLVRPNYCARLINGNTLIAYNTYRNLLEVDREGEALWHFELGNEPVVGGKRRV